MSADTTRMKEEKQRKFHQTLLQRLYPPPPTEEEKEEEDQEQVSETFSCLPEAEELEVEEVFSSPSSHDEEDGENEKLSRAQRKRRRKKKLREAASRRREIIGPLLPGSTSIRSVPEGVRQNAAQGTNTATHISGGAQCCTKQSKVKRRRMSKKAGTTSGIETAAGNESEEQTS